MGSDYVLSRAEGLHRAEIASPFRLKLGLSDGASVAGLRVNDAVVRCLRESAPERKTARQIAEWIVRQYPDESQQKLKQSKVLKDDASLLQQIVAEIGANRPAIEKKNPMLRTTAERPRRYYWSDATDEAEVAAVEDSFPAKLLLEEISDRELDLYPKLGLFLRADASLFSQRIDERRSSNKRGPQGNRWLYPDLIALEDLTSGWMREVRECVTEAGARKFRIWSFEVKLLLNRSNVREAYFQAVSNSSWANLAYLVAKDISGDDTLKELRMLAALHGVGVMQLDGDNPSESQVLIPARERADVDWANFNRLAEENTDFLQVVQRVWEFHRTGTIKVAEWTT